MTDIKNYQLKNKWDGLAQHIASVVHNNTDITILTIFSTLTEVSVYSVYYLVVKGIKAITLEFIGGIDAYYTKQIFDNSAGNFVTLFATHGEIGYKMLMFICYKISTEFSFFLFVFHTMAYLSFIKNNGKSTCCSSSS